jgi:hypothetical protein
MFFHFNLFTTRIEYSTTLSDPNRRFPTNSKRNCKIEKFCSVYSQYQNDNFPNRTMFRCQIGRIFVSRLKCTDRSRLGGAFTPLLPLHPHTHNKKRSFLTGNRNHPTGGPSSRHCTMKADRPMQFTSE